MNDRQWEKLTGLKINRAAETRARATERAAAIQVLGMAPEDPDNPYAASTGEFVMWAREYERKSTT